MHTQRSVQCFAQSIQCHPVRQLLCLSPGYTQTEAERAKTRPGRRTDCYPCEIPPGCLASCLLILPSVWICEMCTFNSSDIYQGPPCTQDDARRSENNSGCLRPSYFAEWAPLDPPYCSWAVALDKAWVRHCHCQSHGAGGSHPAQWKACLVSGPHLSILCPRHWQGAWWTDSWPRPVSGSAQGYRGWQVDPGLHVDGVKSCSLAEGRSVWTLEEGLSFSAFLCQRLL